MLHFGLPTLRLEGKSSVYMYHDHLSVQITGEEEELHNDYETAQRRQHLLSGVMSFNVITSG